MLWVMQLFLKQTAANSKFFRIVNSMKWIWAFVPVLAFYVINFTTSLFWVKLYLTIYPIMLASTFIIALICCIEKLLQGYKLALFYLVAISFVIFSGTLMALGIMERKYYLSLPPTLYDLSIVVEALIICFGILFRYIIIRRERNKLEKTLQQQQLSSSKQLIFTQENERKRIAEDLHDELGSSLAALKLRLQKSSLPEEEMNDILNVVDKASSDTRNISHNLMPPEFEKTSLKDLLSNYYTRLNRESSTRFHFYCSGDNQHFSKENELIIYRIIMELTGNILKHADAAEATIQLIYYADQLEIMGEDNGTGILENENKGIGLKNIQSRVDYLNGELRIDTASGGTTIMIKLPYKSR
jgi:signal transduction histidine kinase